MNEFGTTQSILDGADQAVQRFVFAAWDGIARNAEPWFTATLVLAGALFLLGVQLGYIRATRGSVARLLIAIAVAYSFVNPLNRDAASPRIGQRQSAGLGNQSRLASWLYTSITQVPEAIARQMGQVQALGPVPQGSNPLVQLNASVDANLTHGTHAASLLIKQGGVRNPKPWLWAILLYVVALAATLPILFGLVLSKLAVGALLGLAPFIAVFNLFPYTRRLLDGYFRQLLTFSITPIVIYALVGMASVMTGQVSESLALVSDAETPSMTFIVPYVLVMGVLSYLTLQATSWASAIAGGAALLLPDVTSPAVAAANRSVRSLVRAGDALYQRSRGRLPRGSSPPASITPMRPAPSWVQAHVRRPAPELLPPVSPPRTLSPGPRTPRALPPGPRLLSAGPERKERS